MDMKTAELLSTINQLVSGHTTRPEEIQILDIFDKADTAQLNELLLAVKLDHLFSSMDIHFTGGDNRKRLYELLTVKRVAELSATTRVAIVSALQRGRTGQRDERAIRNIFLATRGADLTLLKNGIDTGADYRDLQQLIFSDLDDSEVRAQILAHLKQEGETGKRHAVKALSDIDDTFYLNLKDRRYPRGTTYPGVVQFYQELVRGPNPASNEQGTLVFLTARPKDRGGAIEEHTRDGLRKRGSLGEFVVLSGDFLHLVGDAELAEKKYENFVQYRQLFKEYGFVFTGDSGQGDAIFGKRIWLEFREDVRGIFIHDVVDTPEDRRALSRNEGVIFFDTYVGAAVEAFNLGLISQEGVGKVVNAAQKELSNIAFADSRQKQDRLADLERDVNRTLNLEQKSAGAS